jgi:hypothetical protein
MLVYVLIWLLLSLLVASIGKRRKFGFWFYFFISILLSPLLGLLLVLVSAPRLPPDRG